MTPRPRTRILSSRRHSQPCRHALPAIRRRGQRPRRMQVPWRYLPSMRAGFVPLLKVEIGIIIALLFFRIALPRLVRLLVGILVVAQPGIVLRRFLAHAFASAKSKSPDRRKSSDRGR